MPDPLLLDINSFLTHTGGDLPFAREIAEESCRVVPEYLANLCAAIDSGDTELVRQSSHRLKGGMRTIYAIPAADAAEKIEKKAAEGDIDSCRELIVPLKVILAATLDTIESFLKK